MSGRPIAVVGIDGFHPLWFEHFVAEGKLPAIGSLIRRGSSAPLISTLPATTPVAWAAIATGCSPAVTGIEGFLLHLPGTRLDERVAGCYSYRCRAEPIWETAVIAGKRSYVVKFPLSYPSTSATFRLDGASGWGGIKCLHESVSAAVTDSLTRSCTSLTFDDAAIWSSERSPSMPAVHYGRWLLPTIWSGPPLELFVALTSDSGGNSVVSLADAPKWDRVLVELREGEWSQPLTVCMQGRRGNADHSFRVKVLSCSTSPVALKLLNTALHERHGHSTPTHVWDKYLPMVGPIEEETEPSLVFSSGLDIETQIEIFHLNADWLQSMSTNLLREEEWDLFMIQMHFVDWAHHMLQGGVDPRHPDFDPLLAPTFENALLESYRLADDIVASVQREVEKDANIVVMGDHGQDIHHTTFRANEWLASEGLLRWLEDAEEVDWSATKAYATGNYIYLNLEGREPTGIVPQAEAEQTLSHIVGKLLNATDPSSNVAPVSVAGNKRVFADLGADGAGVGDIVFCMKSGYQARNGRGPMFAQTRLLHEFTSGHDHFWPLDSSIQTRIIAAGPDFRQGYRHPRAEHVTDVAPTIATVLGIPEPLHSEGKALEELLSKQHPSRLP